MCKLSRFTSMNTFPAVFRVMLLMLACLIPAVQADAELRLSSGGMQFKELRPGTGNPAATGDKALIHFVMWIDDNGERGKEIYNSRADRAAVPFIIGTDKVLPALNEGVVGMRPGGKRLLLVPPAFAYGKKGVNDIIAPDTRLIIILELIEASPAL